MKKTYLTPFMEVYDYPVDEFILAGSHEITGAESAMTEEEVDINLDNNEYDPTKPIDQGGTGFIDVE